MENSYTLFYLVDNRDENALNQVFIDFKSFNYEKEFWNIKIPKVKVEIIENILKYASEYS
jgi:hypothetical protein